MRLNKHSGCCMVPLSSTHHIRFAAIANPRMGKHSGGHTGEEAAAEQTDSGQRVQTVVTSGSCLSVRGLTASPPLRWLNAGIHPTGFQWPPKYLARADAVTLLGKQRPLPTPRFSIALSLCFLPQRRAFFHENFHSA